MKPSRPTPTSNPVLKTPGGNPGGFSFGPFPHHPYTLDHAISYIEVAMSRKSETLFAICVDDEAVGGIGFTIRSDVERFSAEL